MTVQVQGAYAFVLVLARFMGMILLNPLLTRRNVPTRVRMGLSLMLTLLMFSQVDTSQLAIVDDFALLGAIARELAVGIVFGFIFQMFYYLLFFAGDVMDTEFGLSMAKVFDPGTNIQMSLTGTWLQVMFIAYFLAANGLQQILYIYAMSFQTIPLGGAVIGVDLYGFLLQLFTTLFTFLFHLLLPFVAAELALQVALGILMKLVPQIHVFVINFQLKQGLGLLLLFWLAPQIGGFVDKYIVLLFENTQRALTILGGAA